MTGRTPQGSVDDHCQDEAVHVDHHQQARVHRQALIDLYSDTQTLPTRAMLDAVESARLGDASLGTDPTVVRLEAMAAATFAMEAAMLAPSGTMGNLCALLAHDGSALITDVDAHIYCSEAEGFARVANLPYVPVQRQHGVMSAQSLEDQLSSFGVPSGSPPIVVVENSHNRAGGTVTSPEAMGAIHDVAHRFGAIVHIDGARIFNSAVALGVPPRDLAAGADSLMFSLSKGLSAPVGALLVGSSAFISRARHARRLLGGAMRQAGVIAAPGIVALTTMVDRLADDHANARRLAHGLRSCEGLEIVGSTPQTNIVLVDVSSLGVPSDEFVRLLEFRGVRSKSRPRGRVRFTTHRHLGPDEVDRAVRVIIDAFDAMRG